MHAVKRLAVVTAMVVLAGLSGCTAPGPVDGDGPADGIPPGHADAGSNEDGRSCSVARSGEVYILVGYGAGGMPVVSPDRCRVAPGTRITWRGPDNDRRGFEIVFKGASASAQGQQRVASEPGRDRGRASIIAARTRGAYAYSVWANGQELDPQIIIDPQ